jgi:hypothetical protein
MIFVQTDRPGLGPLQEYLSGSAEPATRGVTQAAPAGSLQLTVLVPTSATRAHAEALVLMHGDPLQTRVVTPINLARSVLSFTGNPSPDMIGGIERRRLLERFLAPHNITDPDDVTDFGRAFDDARLASAGKHEIDVHAHAADQPQWQAVADLLDPWTDYLRSHHVVDRVGLLTAAMYAAREPTMSSHWRLSVDDMVVVDTDRLPLPTLRTLTSLIGAMNTDETHQLRAFLSGQVIPVRVTNSVHIQSAAQKTPDAVLIKCGHPALEAEAVVGAIVEALEGGTALADIAVVVPRSRERLRPVARSARRAGVAVAGAPVPRLEGPVVQAMIDRARHADPTSRPAKIARLFAAERAAELARASSVGDMIIGLLVDANDHDHLTCDQWANRLLTHPVAALPPQPAPTNAVTLCTIDELLDRETTPLVVILLGCIEGELPARRPTRRFDPAVLDGPHAYESADHSHIESERARFMSVLHKTAPIGKVICVAAPEPGVLVSRFTEGMAGEQPTLPHRELDPERWPIGLTPTTNPRPLVSGSSLKLSASQINLFDNCPWQYTVQYRLNLRTEGGMQARFGTYVHEVLERFVNNDHGHGISLDGLLTLADECWTKDITDYTPQEDDYRRRASEMLTDWWSRDGEDLLITHRALHTEYKFQITVGDHLVKGFIDRIDKVPGGLSIVDYKTGSKAKTKADTNEDLQLAVYHLAATLDPALNEHGDVVALQLDFLAEKKQVAQFITPQHAEITKARITAVADRMLTEEIDPSVEANCDFCDLSRLCDLQSAGRAVPVRLQGRTKP